jgi:copper(I)-binding protein
MKTITLSLLLGGLLFAGAGHATAADHVRASHAWIRVLPGDLPAGGYVTLQNDSEQPVALSGASSTRYANVMLHHSSTEGGMSRMTMVDTVTVPARGKAILAPAGYHLMLMQAATPVKPGDSIPVTLEVSDGSTLVTGFVARPANATDAGEEQAGH